MTSITTVQDIDNIIEERIEMKSKDASTQLQNAYKGLPVLRYKNQDGSIHNNGTDPLWKEGSIINKEDQDKKQVPGIVVRKNGRLQFYHLNWLSAGDWYKYRVKLTSEFGQHLRNNHPTMQTSNEIRLGKDLNASLEATLVCEKALAQTIMSLKKRQILLEKSYEKTKRERNTNKKLNLVIQKQGLAITQFLNEKWEIQKISVNIWKTDNPEIAEHLCDDCRTFDYNAENNVKCIHDDCPGMCGECVKTKNPEGFEVCACCDKKQELECPICYSMRPVEFCVKGNNCIHHICWKCYGTASKGNNNIKDCPMCRAKF